PGWRAVFEDILTVQFNHRMLAYATFITAIVAYLGGRSAIGPGRRIRYLKALAVVAVLQLALGVATLLSVVAIPLAVLHQAGAILLFCCAVLAYRAHRT
ncbi:MAG TPA: heme A synthase, partial [Rhodospirillaceae bacterium]|nr:heme A synthase [Rhodospirillaceae bacterium]